MVSPPGQRGRKGLVGAFLGRDEWRRRGTDRAQVVENAAHACNFDVQRFDTPCLRFVRYVGRYAAKRAGPRGKLRLDRTREHG